MEESAELEPRMAHEPGFGLMAFAVKPAPIANGLPELAGALPKMAHFELPFIPEVHQSNHWSLPI
jgi:hypothetical protein